MTILIVGGYGTFGGRLVELLMGEPRLTLIVAGRSAERAADFCSRRREAKARLIAAKFDRTQSTLEQLAALAPDLLVDASGPFQAYGEDRYRLIEACIAQRVCYLDLADGSEFVSGVSVLDAAARAADVYVLSGVSSFPVLTAAVVRNLSGDMSRINTIFAGIAPSPYAGVGENVIRAIAGYAGKKVALRRAGRPATGHPFTEQRHYTIAPPGRLPLRRTLFSLVDVPDLHVLPELWPQTQDAWMGAGPVPQVLHRILIAMAWLVRWRVLPSLSPLAPLMHFATNHLRWGEHRGGMFIEVTGADGRQRAVTRSWHLVAEGQDGPYIPSMAVEAIVRKALAGRVPVSGARPAIKELELLDYEGLFAQRAIYTGRRDEQGDQNTPLFARLLGEAWHLLPAALRDMHDIGSQKVAEGRCSIERGRGLLANLTATVFRFPKTSADSPVRVHFTAANGTERWTREFGKDVLSSTMLHGQGRCKRLLCERFGVFDFAQALIIENNRLRYELRGWSVFGLPLPLWAAPRSNSWEAETDGRFHFHVELSHPFLGLIVRYRGWLSPASMMEPL